MGKHTKIEYRVNQSQKNRSNTGNGYRLLLADDDYEMRRLLAWSLNREGYQVTECKDGNTLMKKMGSIPNEGVQPFDLIISDIRMPGFTGLQALESAQNIEALPPMILITAFPDDETKKMARQLGAVAVMEKPFDLDALLGNVRQILIPVQNGKRLSSDPALEHSTSLPFTVDITFRHCKGVEAVSEFIGEMAAKLDPLADNIRQLHVVVEDLSPETHRKHRYHIGIHIVVNEDKPIVVSHNTNNAGGYENLYHGIRIAFYMASRQLKHALSKRCAKRSTRRGPSQPKIVDECDCIL